MSSSQGFTLIELLITTFIIGTVVTGLFGLFVLNLRGAQGGELRVAGIALANEKMEMIRNLPYDDVGTIGGVPAGAIEPNETITRNSVPYTVETDIRYIDDPFDGVVGGSLEGQTVVAHKPPGNPGGCQTIVVGDAAAPAHQAHGDDIGQPCPGDPDPSGADPVGTDYKQARVSVTWPSQYNVSPVLLIALIAPQGIEGGENQGTLDFQVLDALGQPIQNALLTVINDAVNPTINTTTQSDSNGRVVLPGLPVSAGSYELLVTKSGYTTEQTFDQTATFFPDPDYAHLSMIDREITEKTFFIDQIGSLEVTIEEDGTSGGPVASLAYTLRGTKRIGIDDQAEVVYSVNEQATTDSQGENSHADLAWDIYDITIDGVATGFDVKESSIPLPLSLNPADELELTITVVDHSDSSLQVTVLDELQAPVDNATVQLVDGVSYDETLGTGLVGQVLFQELPADGEYTLTIDAPNFQTNQQDVTVEGTTQVSVELTPDP